MTKQPGSMVGQSIAESMKLDDAAELDRVYEALGIAGNMSPVDEIKRLRAALTDIATLKVTGGAAANLAEQALEQRTETAK